MNGQLEHISSRVFAGADDKSNVCESQRLLLFQNPGIRTL